MEKKDLKEPFELFGIECSKGWVGIIEPILTYIKEYNIGKEKDEQIEIHQIKEKFGTLRVYTSFETKELSDLILEAEYQSTRTCELCGSQKNVGHTVGGWITTCCEKCVTEMSKKRNAPYKWKPNNCDTNIKWYEIKPNQEKEIVYVSTKI